MSNRDDQIFDLLCQYGELSVQQLSELLKVSPASIRRDLNELNGHRFINRTHGGVSLSNVVSHTPLPIHKPVVDPREARAIAYQALQLIERGAVIGLSGGRICTELALNLRLREGITIVTNAINIAAELVGLPGIQVMVTGGFLDPRSFELTSQMIKTSLSSVRLHKYFVGVDGITVEHGMTNHNEAAALVAREFMKHSDQTILLADSSKFKRSDLTKVADIDEIHTLITSDSTPHGTIEQFQHAGVCCMVAQCT